MSNLTKTILFLSLAVVLTACSTSGEQTSERAKTDAFEPPVLVPPVIPKFETPME